MQDALLPIVTFALPATALLLYASVRGLPAGAEGMTMGMILTVALFWLVGFLLRAFRATQGARSSCTVEPRPVQPAPTLAQMPASDALQLPAPPVNRVMAVLRPDRPALPAPQEPPAMLVLPPRREPEPVRAGKKGKGKK